MAMAETMLTLRGSYGKKNSVDGTRERSLLISEGIVSAWVLIPALVNHNQAIFSVSPGTEKLSKSSKADKKL